MVDPLDGTREFIKRNGQFTVNIALIKQGNPIMGVVYAPDIPSIYFTFGKTACLLEDFDPNLNFDQFRDFLSMNKIQLPVKIKRQNYIVLASLSHQNRETKNYLKKLKTENQNIEIFNIGSSLKFCMIAAGKADIYPRFSTISEWDSAAGHAVILAAGGSMVDALSGNPIIYNKENLVNPWFIAKI
jgi:3'(2'), 5'-bisphosphate nucleotidase